MKPPKTKDAKSGSVEHLLPPVYLSRDGQEGDCFYEEEFRLSVVSSDLQDSLNLSADRSYIRVDLKTGDRFQYSLESLISKCFQNGFEIHRISFLAEIEYSASMPEVTGKPFDFNYPISVTSGLHPKEIATRVRNDFFHGQGPVRTEEGSGYFVLLVESSFRDCPDFASFQKWCIEKREYLFSRHRQRRTSAKFEWKPGYQLDGHEEVRDVQMLGQLTQNYKRSDCRRFTVAEISGAGNVAVMNETTVFTDLISDVKASQSSIRKKIAECAVNRASLTDEALFENRKLISSKQTGEYVDEISEGLGESDHVRISVPAGGGRLLVACELLDLLLADYEGLLRRVLYIAENENMARHAMSKISEYTGIEAVEVSNVRDLPRDSEISVISAELLEDDGFKSIQSDLYNFVICEEIDGLAEAARYFETKIFGMTRRPTLELKLDGVEWFDCSPVTVRTRERIISPFSVLALPDEELFKKSFALDMAALKQGVFLATPGTFRDTLLEIRGFCGIYLFAQKVGLSEKDPRVKQVFKSVPVQDLSVCPALFCMLSLQSFLSMVNVPELQALGKKFHEELPVDDRDKVAKVSELLEFTKKLSYLGNDYPELSAFAKSLLSFSGEPERYIGAFGIAFEVNRFLFEKSSLSAALLYSVCTNLNKLNFLLWANSFTDRELGEPGRSKGSSFLSVFEGVDTIKDGSSYPLNGFGSAFGDNPNSCKLDLSIFREVICLLDSAEDQEKPARVYDPSCGVGGFLLMALEKLQSANCGDQVSLRDLMNGISGDDSDPMSVNLAKTAMIHLTAGLSRKDDTYSDPGEAPFTDFISEYIINAAPNINRSDSIEKNSTKVREADFLICDPPFDTLLEDGTFDHHRFIEMGVEIAAKGGSAAILLPESFLHSDRDLEVRRKLIEARILSKIRILPGRNSIEEEIDDRTDRVFLSLERDDIEKNESLIISHWRKRDEVRSIPYSDFVKDPVLTLQFRDIWESATSKAKKKSTQAKAFGHEAFKEYLNNEVHMMQIFTDSVKKYAEDASEAAAFITDGQNERKENHFTGETIKARLGELCEVEVVHDPEMYDFDGKEFVYTKIREPHAQFRRGLFWNWLKSRNGKVRLSPYDQGFLLVKPRNDQNLRNDYLAYWMNNLGSSSGGGNLVQMLSMSATIDGLIHKLEESIFTAEIFLPSLEMQDRLVKILKNPYAVKVLGKPKSGWNSDKSINPDFARLLFLFDGE